MTNLWRKKQLMVDPEIAEEVLNWHGGGGTPTYALGSAAYAGHPVSLSMLDAAIEELDSSESDDRTLEQVTGDLQQVRLYWPEYTMEFYGIPQYEVDVEYDQMDYGFGREDEKEFARNALEMEGHIKEKEGLGPTEEELRRGNDGEED